jgi:cobaltochelatase CobS
MTLSETRREAIRLQCEAQLGPRGSLARVTSSPPETANRKIVARWLTNGFGISADAAHHLSLIELERAYNLTDDSGIEAIRTKGRKNREAMLEIADADEIDDIDVGTTTTVATNGHDKTPPQGLLDAVQVLGSYINTRAEIDEARVRDIARQEVERTTRVIRVETYREDVLINTLDEHMHPLFERLLKIAQSRGDDGYVPGIMISGEASSGKTYACKQVSKALGLPFHFNGAISMAYEMLGFIDANGTYHRTPFREAYEHGGAYAFDEMDRCGDPRALLAVNPHLANAFGVFPDGQIARHKDFLLMGTANTWGFGATADYSGATKLDAAFKSRFPTRLTWNIDEQFETTISGNPAWAARVQRARANGKKHGIKVLIDTRITLAGAAHIRNGFTPDEAAELTYLADLTPEQRTQVGG